MLLFTAKVTLEVAWQATWVTLNVLQGEMVSGVTYNAFLFPKLTRHGDDPTIMQWFISPANQLSGIKLLVVRDDNIGATSLVLDFLKIEDKGFDLFPLGSGFSKTKNRLLVSYTADKNAQVSMVGAWVEVYGVLVLVPLAV